MGDGGIKAGHLRQDGLAQLHRLGDGVEVAERQVDAAFQPLEGGLHDRLALPAEAFPHLPCPLGRTGTEKTIKTEDGSETAHDLLTPL